MRNRRRHGRRDGRNYSRNRNKKNTNKVYAAIVIAVIAVVVAVVINENYDVTIYEQKVGEFIPVATIEKTFKDMYEKIPVESIENAFSDISDALPIKITAKPETLESKLKDCSVYEKNYLESYKNVKTTPDNTAAMLGDALTQVQKTRACEQYNKQIQMQQASQGIVTSEPVSNVFLHGMMVPPWTGPDGVTHDKPPIVGTFSIEKIILSEKEYYRIISINLNIKAENLELGDTVFLSPIDFTLENEKGKKYVNQPQECSSPLTYQITGKTGSNLSVIVCYEVEKEFDRFDVFFRSEDHKNYKIGSFTLN